MKTHQELIQIQSLDGNIYNGLKLKHQKDLPKSAELYKCETESDTLNSFNIYKKVSKKDIKFYFVFSKYF
tara:strand:+ start:780 stop:989 length:210 start_codon:yes stop_codon:yes gene_type:complete